MTTYCTSVLPQHELNGQQTFVSIQISRIQLWLSFYYHLYIQHTVDKTPKAYSWLSGDTMHQVKYCIIKLHCLTFSL